MAGLPLVASAGMLVAICASQILLLLKLYLILYQNKLHSFPLSPCDGRLEISASRPSANADRPVGSQSLRRCRRRHHRHRSLDFRSLLMIRQLGAVRHAFQRSTRKRWCFSFRCCCLRGRRLKWQWTVTDGHSGRIIGMSSLLKSARMAAHVRAS